MLSRVAAVKAPRTHNRCRVTGSSGRRREGRESEQQRPNMSRHHFYSSVLLLLVMMMCCNTGGAATAVVTAPGSGNAKETYFAWRDKSGKETVSSLRVPSLVEMNGDVFAVAEAHCKEGTEKVFTGIASKLLALTGEQTRKELATTEVKTQVLEECSSEKEKVTCRIADRADSQSQTRIHVGRPTTVVKGSDIYMLAGSYSWTLTADDQAADAGDWGLMLVKGNVSEEAESKKRILWNDTYAIPWNYKGKQHESLTKLTGSGGSGVKMNDGTLVFPVEGTKKLNGTENDGRTVSLIIHSSDAAGWVLPKGMSADGCGDPSVVEWKDKLIMMTACDDGRRRVYESGDKGESWTEALGTLSRVWGNKRVEKVDIVRSGFITATVGNDNKKVMLVTLPVYAKKDEKDNEEKSVLHLWLTDNTHIVDIGPVSEKDEEDVAASSLLYKSGGNGDTNEQEEKLIALYEKKGGDDVTPHSLLTVPLNKQLEKVKEVLAAWKEADDTVSKLCATLVAREVTSPDNACSAAMPVDGLVGFLSGKFSRKTWRDEYLGVNATVHNNDDGATKASDGVTFQGAWAEWPVGRQGENQLYHFANYNFTLVVTVSIDGEPKEDTPIPLMGVHLEGKDKLMELSYDSEKKWQVLCSDGKIKKLKITWETRTQYQVAIVLRNGNQGFAYVDGKRVCGDVQRSLDNTDSKGISHFYIGGDGSSAGSKEDVSVTVTNVLLYNRPLTFSGGNAEVEEVTDSPSADQEPSAEPASPFVARDQNAAPSAGELPDVPVEQTTSQQSPQKSETQKNTMVRESAATQETPANTSEGSVEKAAASKSHAAGEATGDGSTVRGSGLLPSLLLLLGLWGFAAL
ncbi:putative trans-sialidase, Group V [Trypanosoma cruzi]|nr:putative trans-sialidase, Group V [Trypanosoma cruzi]